MNHAKLIAQEYGYSDPIEAIEHNGWAFDSIVPGICIDCNTVEPTCEPDAHNNWCDNCCGNSVKSILVLIGVI